MNPANVAQKPLESLAALKQTLIAALPNVITALVILIVGWLLAWLLSRASRRSFQRLALRMPIGDTRADADKPVDDHGAGRVAAEGVYWLVLLTTLVLVADALGVPVLNKWLAAFANFAPKIVISVAVVFGGAVAGRLAGVAIEKAATRMAPRQARTLARLTRVAIVIAALLIAAAELGLDVSLLTQVLLVVLAATLGGGALAFGLGARGPIANILAMHYVNKSYRVGQTIRLGNEQGRIVRTSSTEVLLDTPEGELSIPGQVFSERPCVVLSQGDDDET
jgi:small-conductance mechanosensitive channel